MVTKSIEGNNRKGHVVEMDNYFTLISLFEELALDGTYATAMVQCDRIGISQVMKNRVELNLASQRTMVWKMHELHGMASACWKDQCPLFLLSSRVLPIDC